MTELIHLIWLSQRSWNLSYLFQFPLYLSPSFNHISFCSQTNLIHLPSWFISQAHSSAKLIYQPSCLFNELSFYRDMLENVCRTGALLDKTKLFLIIHLTTSWRESERANKWAQRSAQAKHAVWSKQMSEQCKWKSKQMSEWLSTSAPILGCFEPLCGGFICFEQTVLPSNVNRYMLICWQYDVQMSWRLIRLPYSA